MRQYNKYLIKNTDQFDPEYYSSVNDEVSTINELTKHLPSPAKAEIIVSFLKDHFLKNDWLKTNRELTDLITSGSLFTGSIESLFESCRENLIFREHLEVYLMEMFSKISSTASKN